MACVILYCLVTDDLLFIGKSQSASRPSVIPFCLSSDNFIPLCPIICWIWCYKIATSFLQQGVYRREATWKKLRMPRLFSDAPSEKFATYIMEIVFIFVHLFFSVRDILKKYPHFISMSQLTSISLWLPQSPSSI